MSGEPQETRLEPVMLSALQHYQFCPRQCALIHVEQAWGENYLTASGRILHARVDRKGSETRRDVHVATALRLASEKYGIFGVADMVEFHKSESPFSMDGTRIAARLPRLGGWWRPFPVEYKRGKPKLHRADEVQLCAQALCLEEMLGVVIPDGALFYGETRRRIDVEFGEDLRHLTLSTVVKVRELLSSGAVPSALYSKDCDACSLIDVCCPRDGRSSRTWIDSELAVI